eukprot:239941-Prorocentrum_minimum.AAC.2
MSPYRLRFAFVTFVGCDRPLHFTLDPQDCLPDVSRGEEGPGGAGRLRTKGGAKCATGWDLIDRTVAEWRANICDGGRTRVQRMP